MTTKYQVNYLPAASDDMDDIYFYIAFRLGEPQIAKKQLHRLYQAVHSLNAFPERHQKVEREPWASLKMRRMPVDNYIVFYTVDRERSVVNVARVVYGGRNIEDIINQ